MKGGAPSLWTLRALYFVLFTSFGCTLPFVSVWLGTFQGQTAATVGALIAGARLISAFASPLWALLADKFQVHRLILNLSLIVSALAFLVSSLPPFAPWGTGSSPRKTAGVILYLLFALLRSPTASLLDGLTLRTLEARQLEHGQYGKIRLAGAVSWGLTSFLAGLLLELAGFGVVAAVSLGVGVLFSVGTFAAGNWPPPKKDGAVLQPFAVRTKALLRQRQVIFFMLVSVFGGAAGTIVNTFLLLYLQQELGASELLLGVSVTVTVLVEIPLFYVSSWLLKKVGVRGLIVAAHLAYVFRVIGYTLIENPWAVLPFELLHGLTFAAFWAAGVAHMNSCAPVGLEASAQGFFNGAYGGAGSALGALAGGLVYGAYGAKILFYGTAGAMTLSLCFFLVTYRTPSKSPGFARESLLDGEELRQALLSDSSDDFDSDD